MGTILLISALIILMIIILIILYTTGNITAFWISLSIEIFLAIGSYILGKLKGWKYGLKLKLFEIFKPNLEVRISPAYLYKIHIQNKYLLVKNRNRGIYQPVGGVYKFYDSAKNFLNSIEFKTDNKMKQDEINSNDLRIRIKAKYISKFLDWFYSNKDREISYDREFNEELLETKILSNNFNKIKSKKIKTIKNTIEFSTFFQVYEIKPKDIIEIEYTPEQIDELQNMLTKKSNDYYFATEDEILSNGITLDSQEVKFGDHTKYIL